MSWIWIDDKSGDVIASANMWGLYLIIREMLNKLDYKVVSENATPTHCYITVHSDSE